MATILITGGTGLVGTRLTTLLIQKGYNVTYLSHTQKKNNQTEKIKTFAWDIEKQTIDTEALKEADYIIHLAGASVAGKRWTTKRKKEIIDSRVQSTNLLFKTLQKTENYVKAFISASAIGYYGEDGSHWLTENSPAAVDFLAFTCSEWENAVKQFSKLNIREVRLRTGIVLARQGGALPEFTTPIKFGVAPLFRMGKPWYSWIHLDDLCDMYIYTIENESLKGAYNAVAPNPVKLGKLINNIRRKVNRFSIPAPVPTFVLRVMIGEMAETLVSSARVSAEKIQQAGFNFQFEEIEKAVDDLL